MFDHTAVGIFIHIVAAKIRLSAYFKHVSVGTSLALVSKLVADRNQRIGNGMIHASFWRGKL